MVPGFRDHVPTNAGCDLANVACGAAINFDNCRLEKPVDWSETDQFVAAIRAMFPEGGNVTNNKVQVSDILVMKEAILAVDGTCPLRLVDDVVAHALAWAGRVEAARIEGIHTKEIADFCLAVSKISSAKHRSGYYFSGVR